MVGCSAFGCTNRSSQKSAKQQKLELSKKIFFFKFPSNPDRRKQWMKIMGKKNGVPVKNTKHAHMCSLHFTEESFDRSSLLVLRLRPHAVPTILGSFSRQLKTSRKKRTNLSPVQESSKINNSEVSHPGIKVEKSYILMEPLPSVNIKQEENSDEEINVSNTSSNTDVNQSEFIVPDTNISSKQINFIDKQTNNVVMLTNVNPILSHNGCSVFMVTAKNDSEATNKAKSSTELSTVNTEVYIKTEIPDGEEIHNDTIVVSEEHMVSVTQDDSYKPVQTNTSILKNNLATTSNKETVDKNNRGPDKTMINKRNNTMSTKECATTVDQSESEIEHYSAEVLRNILEIERKEHRSKVKALQAIIRRLKKANKKLKEAKKK